MTKRDEARSLAASGVSKTEISDRLGVSRMTVHRWLKDDVHTNAAAALSGEGFDVDGAPTVFRGDELDEVVPLYVRIDALVHGVDRDDETVTRATRILRKLLPDPATDTEINEATFRLLRSVAEFRKEQGLHAEACAAAAGMSSPAEIEAALMLEYDDETIRRVIDGFDLSDPLAVEETDD